MDDIPDISNFVDEQAGKGEQEQIDRDAETREAIKEKAQRLGRLISQTAEYEYLASAQKEISDDRDATEALNRLQELQETLVSTVERGEEPSEDLLEEREELARTLQRNPRYQSLVSAQSNFDKLMKKVNRAIGAGMKEGEDSQIILPS
jgi:cell fate (sporulation/competence/biofilm development) regulator YlbF (YheA/YmcA/DUF963 family)